MQINGNDKNFDGFRIYNNNEILWSTDRNDFTLRRFNDDGSLAQFGTRITGINLTDEPRRSTKLNLKRTDCFMIKEPALKNPVLYIHSSIIDVIRHGEAVNIKQAHQTSYLDTATLRCLEGCFIYDDLELEEIENGHVFKSPKEADSYFYSKRKDKHYIKHHIDKEVKEIIVTSDYISRTEYDELYYYAEELKDEFKDVYGVNIYTHDLLKILENYDIKKKG